MHHSFQIPHHRIVRDLSAWQLGRIWVGEKATNERGSQCGYILEPTLHCKMDLSTAVAAPPPPPPRPTLVPPHLMLPGILLPKQHLSASSSSSSSSETGRPTAAQDGIGAIVASNSSSSSSSSSPPSSTHTKVSLFSISRDLLNLQCIVAV